MTAVLRAAALAALLGLAAPAARPAPPPPADEAARLEAQLVALQGKGRLFEALGVAERRAALLDRRLDPADPALARAHEAVATLRGATGDYPGALAASGRVLALREAAGADPQAVAGTLDTMAAWLQVLGREEEARALQARSLALYEGLYGKDSPMLAVRLQLMASFAVMGRDFGRAEALYGRALAIQEAVSGPDSQAMTSLLAGVAWMHWWRGDLARAVDTYRRVMAIWAKEPALYATALSAFTEIEARLLDGLGRSREAGEAWRRAEAAHRAELARREAEGGPDAPMTLVALRSLAGHLHQRGRLDEARPLYARLLAAEERQHGRDAMGTLGTLLSLARLSQQAGDGRQARALYGRAIRLQRKAWGDFQALSTESLLATLDEQEGRWAAAARRLERQLAAWTKVYGERHANLVAPLAWLARLRWAEGKVPAAVALLSRAQAIAEPMLRAWLATGTEDDRRSALAQYAWHLDLAVSLDAAGADPAATRLALDVVLHRKGRLLDAVTESVGTLRRRLSPEDRKLFDDLNAARAQLATLAGKGPAPGEEAAYRRALAAVEDRIRRLELTIGERSAEFRAQSAPVSVEAVQAALPEGAALVEYVIYGRIDPARAAAEGYRPPLHYAAYVLRREGPPVRVELGPAAAIDAAVPDLRRALATPTGPDPVAAAQALDALVMAPVRAVLGETRRLLVAPDGALNLVPFAALADEQGRWLVQRYHVTYLSSGRDLLRLSVEVAPRGGPVIFANPDFDGDGAEGPPPSPEAPAPETPPGTRGRRSRALGEQHWAPLPGTDGEAKALAGVLPAAALRIGRGATEEALKAVEAPRLLHVATHGFFLPGEATADGEVASLAPAPAPGVTAAGVAAAPPPTENPLLRSGLALTGANRLQSRRDDGVLTALEASGLDLWGTQLVVLSACETGVGAVAAGDGVYGLRRALVMAGSESQLLSLWQVDDEATRDLMVGLYKRLLDGDGRGEALRAMQLRMQRDPLRAHPYYWASFIPAGDWRPLTGSTAGPSPGPGPSPAPSPAPSGGPPAPP